MVAIPLSFAVSMGTSAKDFFIVSNQVPPGGMTAAEDMFESSLTDNYGFRGGKESRVTRGDTARGDKEASCYRTRGARNAGAV